MTLVIYCHACGLNHHLGQRDAEDAIQGLIATLTAEQADGDVFSNRAEGDPAADQLTYEFCIMDELPIWRDGEMLSEHLEGMREARLWQDRKVPRKDRG